MPSDTTPEALSDRRVRTLLRDLTKRMPEHVPAEEAEREASILKNLLLTHLALDDRDSRPKDRPIEDAAVFPAMFSALAALSRDAGNAALAERYARYGNVLDASLRGLRATPVESAETPTGSPSLLVEAAPSVLDALPVETAGIPSLPPSPEIVAVILPTPSVPETALESPSFVSRLAPRDSDMPEKDHLSALAAYDRAWASIESIGRRRQWQNFKEALSGTAGTRPFARCDAQVFAQRLERMHQVGRSFGLIRPDEAIGDGPPDRLAAALGRLRDAHADVSETRARETGGKRASAAR